MKESKRESRLCYVDEHIMYFTDNFENQWGDDWDDVPYYCNAGEPYEVRWDSSDEQNKHAGRLRYLAYLPNKYAYGIQTPDEANTNYSVADINGGAVAWLYNRKRKSSLMAGATIKEAIKWCRENDVKVGELE